MRWLGAIVACTGALACAACLRPSSRTCASSDNTESWLCPANLACAQPPTYCGNPQLIEQCMGKNDFDPCMYSDSQAGACVKGACTACSFDLEGCSFTGWNPMTSPTGGDLHAVWATPELGEAHAAGTGSSMVHYNGLGWTPEPFPTLATGTYVAQIWGPAPKDTYAVASSGEIFHYDGTTWSQTTMFPTSAGGVGGVAGHVVVAGSNGTLMEYVNGSWSTTSMVLGLPAGLTGVWGSDPDIFVVGGAGLVLRYHGGWAISRPATAGDPQLRAIWGSSPADVYAVGDRSATSSTILHYNGSSWTPEMVVSTVVNLKGVWGTGPDDVYAVSDSGAILHRTGGTWSSMSVSSQPLYGITSNAKDVLVVGNLGQIWRLTY